MARGGLELISRRSSLTSARRNSKNGLSFSPWLSLERVFRPRLARVRDVRREIRRRARVGVGPPRARKGRTARNPMGAVAPGVGGPRNPRTVYPPSPMGNRACRPPGAWLAKIQPTYPNKKFANPGPRSPVPKHRPTDHPPTPSNPLKNNQKHQHPPLPGGTVAKHKG
jgi:hypothetical protein